MNSPQKVEFLVEIQRAGASSFVASCYGIREIGKTAAAALSQCVRELGRRKELEGFHWREKDSGVNGVIGPQKRKPSGARNKSKGEVFDLLGGKMNGLRRMKD